jgi:hypothetical protein
VAFEKAHIKEHNVDLLFEERQLEEEGISLPRVWIRIFRLPKKLREFSVLWALGSVLGATQSVDMVTSLRRNYSRVEVAVLNVDLLPNMIDTVVIGDRLYSLPIQVEGREESEEAGAQKDLDVGSNDKGTGANESSGTREQGDNERKGNDQGEGSDQKNYQSNGAKHYSGPSKGLSAGTVARHGVVNTSSGKSCQQETNSVTGSLQEFWLVGKRTQMVLEPVKELSPKNWASRVSRNPNQKKLTLSGSRTQHKGPL